MWTNKSRARSACVKSWAMKPGLYGASVKPHSKTMTVRGTDHIWRFKNMTITIPAFWVGVIATVFSEFVALVIYGITHRH